MATIHQRTHPEPVDGCWKCKLAQVNLAPSATPTRDRGAGETNAREERWNRDMPAYRRLRRDGLQPRHIDGSAHLEANADTALEVEGGHVLDKVQRVKVEELLRDTG